MKTLTCKDLGGTCDIAINGNSFEEMGHNCKVHVMEQINLGDEVHKAAAAKMMNATSEEQQSMMKEFEKRYNEAPSIY
jgi:predicted small metal-binding protein